MHVEGYFVCLQILCLSESVTFTERCEEALKTSSLTNLILEMKKQLESYTSVDVQGANVLELKLKALIMDTIHNIEVVEMLSDLQVAAASDWKWQKQLRYYMARSGTGVMRMVDAEFNYTYEYQGNAPKLVHTPLTDKCYLTLTQGSCLQLVL